MGNRGIKVSELFQVAALGFLLTACGQTGGPPTVSSSVQEPNTTLIGVFGTGSHSLDLTHVQPNIELDSVSILPTCDSDLWRNQARNYTNTGLVNPLPTLAAGTQRGRMIFTGSLTEGELQIGYLKNSGLFDDFCRQLQGEHFTYRASSEGLLLITIAPGKAWNGAETILPRQ